MRNVCIGLAIFEIRPNLFNEIIYGEGGAINPISYGGGVECTPLALF